MLRAARSPGGPGVAHLGRLGKLAKQPDDERRIREISEMFWTAVRPGFDAERFRAAQPETAKLVVDVEARPSPPRGRGRSGADAQ